MKAMNRQRSRKDSASLCVVCCEEHEFYAIGSCDHVVCYRCSVRMRILGSENYCPVCRTDLDKVFLSTSWHSYAEVSTRAIPSLFDKKHGIIYESQQIKKKVKELLEHKCSVCSEGQSSFQFFSQLRSHMKKVHQLYYCDLCVDHLRKFSHERKAYNRSDLARHRRMGDADDTSYKGHPLCQFCDQRYLDNDELHRHLRKEHYYCHICEKFGSQEYYENYEVLADHFRTEHFLCEEGECLHEKFVVFSTKIDMQAHIASKHSLKLSKAQARQARQVEVDFQFAPRSKPQWRAVSGRDYVEVQSSEQSHRYSRNRNREQDAASDRGIMEDYQQAVINSLSEQPGNDKAPSPKSKQRTTKSSKSTRQVEEDSTKLNKPEEKLSGACSQPAAQQSLKEPNCSTNGAVLDEFPSLYSFSQTGKQQSSNKPNITKPVSKQETVKLASYSNPRQRNLDEDFPSLNTVSKSSQSSSKFTQPPGFSKAATVAETSRFTDKGHQVKVPPGLIAPGLNKAPPGLSNAPAIVGKAPPGIGNLPPGISNAPIIVGNAPPGIGNAPSGLSNAPSGLSNAQSGLSNAPSGRSNAPSGRSNAPSGLSNAPSGLSNAKKISVGLQQTNSIKESIATSSSTKDPKPQVKEKPELRQSNSVQERNQNLVETIRKLLGYNKEKFAEFKALSGLFRKGDCSADEYYTKCCDLFESNIGSVFNELVDLLPDEEKQKELLRAWQDAKIKTKNEGKSLVKQKQTEPEISVWGGRSAPPVSQEHPVTQASLVIQGPLVMSSQDFPSLPSASKARAAPRVYKPNKQSVSLKSAWVRGK